VRSFVVLGYPSSRYHLFHSIGIFPHYPTGMVTERTCKLSKIIEKSQSFALYIRKFHFSPPFFFQGSDDGMSPWLGRTG
jgi:hypothetical protein